jgi:hypothetical protein
VHGSVPYSVGQGHGLRWVHGRRLRGGTSPPIFGVGDKVSYIPPNIFTVQKVIFNAFSVLGCFYKKLLQQELSEVIGRPQGGLFRRAILL